MRARFFWLLATCLPGWGASCPWMNAATAAGALGGDGEVRESYTPETGCRFAEGARELRIEVKPGASVATALCANAVRLSGIGNEAFYCAGSHEVLGRVRDRVFVLRFSFNAGRELSRKMADIVAGNLY